MRFIIIFVLCAPLILISADDLSENEISLDETNGDEVIHRVIEINDIDEDTEYVEDEEILNLEELYKDSVQAYLDEDWDGCIEGFTEAIRGYKEYKNAVIKCRKDCRALAGGFQPIFPYNVEDLHFYEKKVRETLCLLNCSQNYRDTHGEDSLKRLPEEIEKKFAELAAYEYLQMCYYQKDRFEDAANAVFTYLTAFPKHEMSLKNLRFYIDQRNVDESKIMNLESEPFATFYASGVRAYDEERYEDVIKYFEKSLDLYMASEEDCRYYCEGPFNQGWLPEFIPSVANHFTYCMKCKLRCSTRMNHVNGEYYADLLPSHYHYLQFAYYKVGDLKNACAAVSSYLLFYPSDQMMLKNEEYYSKLPKVEEDYFTPREKAVEYVKRQQYEKRLSRYIFEEFLILRPRLNSTKSKKELVENEVSEEQLTDHPPPGHSPAHNERFSNETQHWRKAEKNSLPEVKNLLTNTDKNIHIIADENDLGGESRYLAEGLLNNSECRSLIDLAQMAAVEGDGYEGNSSPHTKHERFEGLTLGRAALMVYFGRLDPDVLELVLSSSEVAREHVQTYFQLDRHLYSTYTHLACRSALPDSPMDRQDLSHAIHADNCIILQNGTCISEWPAYTFRDYSAILYLNEDFEGGEFIFAADSSARTIQSTIRPSCGRMVAFSASEKNLHGVRGVLRGTRCALGLWFTFDRENFEIERQLAIAIMQRVRREGTSEIQVGESMNSIDYEDTLFDRLKTDSKLRQLFETLRYKEDED